MKVLVTGGTGYIGSHTVVELLENNYEVVIVDDLSNSYEDVLTRINIITSKKPIFYKVDCCNKEELEEIFVKENIDAIIHFAGYKAVGESVKEPYKYYSNNLISTLNIIGMMLKYNINDLVFSSSATVYGDSKVMPLKEDFETGKASNPYGQTKCMIEKILIDVQKAHPNLNIALLRYFNPIGAHHTGLIGEEPNDIPNNLMPYITQVAIGKLDHLDIYGNDYDTADGTGVRDYIHVVDLAKGHIKALEKLQNGAGLFTCNLGTGSGTSVFELIRCFEKVNDIKIPYQIKPRRNGDVAISYASNLKAKEELNWECEKSIDDACKDAYRWQVKNPNGYHK